MASVVSRTGEHYIVTSCIEKLCCHHHLLLLTCICVWRLTLIHQVEQVCLISCLILMTNSTCGANSIMTYTRCSCTKSTSIISIMLRHHSHIILVLLVSAKVVMSSLVSSIALPQFSHEVTIEHGLPHLHLLVAMTFV